MAQPIFKVGDKVKRTYDDWSGVRRGKIYEVSDICHGSMIHLVGFGDILYYSDLFELVEEPEVNKHIFKVGDLIVCIYKDKTDICKDTDEIKLWEVCRVTYVFEDGTIGCTGSPYVQDSSNFILKSEYDSLKLEYDSLYPKTISRSPWAIPYTEPYRPQIVGLGDMRYHSNPYLAYETENLFTKIKNTTMNLIKYAKNLTLSADDKLLREMNLVNECGDYTVEAREIVMNKLMEDNKPYLLEVAKKAKEEKEGK